MLAAVAWLKEHTKHVQLSVTTILLHQTLVFRKADTVTPKEYV